MRDGSRRGLRILAEFGDEIHNARLAGGVSLATLGRASGVSRSEMSRVEHGEARWLSVVAASRIAAAAGLELRVRAFPAGSPIRDIAHVELINRFRARVSPSFRWFDEAPVGAGDQRALDVLLIGAGVRIGVEAETRVRDVQALTREVELKRRDANLDRCVLPLLRSLRSAETTLRRTFPGATRSTLNALARGRDPGVDAILLL